MPLLQNPGRKNGKECIKRRNVVHGRLNNSEIDGSPQRTRISFLGMTPGISWSVMTEFIELSLGGDFVSDGKREMNLGEALLHSSQLLVPTRYRFLAQKYPLTLLSTVCCPIYQYLPSLPLICTFPICISLRRNYKV